MKKTNNSKSKTPRKKKTIISLVLTLVGLAGLAGIGSGILQYGVAAVGCMRAPVAASNFMAGHSYILPGEYGYGPGVFNEYYCSEQAAKAAGFRPGVSTETGEAESRARQKEQEELERFSPSKVSFKAYVPTSNGYSAGKIRLDQMYDGYQISFPIKKDGSNVANVQEGTAPNSRETCSRAEDVCETLGTDASGRVIKKQTNKEDNGKALPNSYGVTIDGTFISIYGTSLDLNDADALSIINSLAEYKDE